MTTDEEYIYKEAMDAIRACGDKYDAKAYALSHSKLCREQENLEFAALWVEIANMVDVLKDMPMPDLILTAAHGEHSEART